MLVDGDNSLGMLLLELRRLRGNLLEVDVLGLELGDNLLEALAAGAWT